MSSTAAPTFGHSTTLFARFMNSLDRLLMAWHEVSTRNGDVPRFGL